jgi:Mrp family chromosome partitioning ATPase
MRPPFAFPGGVKDETTPPRAQPRAPDLRRAISRQVWLANRAANALRRPAFIGAISVGTFITALAAMVVVPRTQEKPAVPIQLSQRPETLSLAATVASGRVNVARAESALVAVRLEVAAADSIAALQPVDTLSTVQRMARDSAAAQLQRLDGALARAQQAPLLSSYRSLADLPELRGDARVRTLLDTLADIERERETFGAAGGVDPIFVALTSRASEVGRALQSIASEHREDLVARMGTDSLAEPVVAAPVIDSTTHLAARDSLQTAVQEASRELALRRARSLAHDAAERRARAEANAVAPLLALLAAAFVLSWVVGFAVAFIAELKRPRVAHASEVERFLGVRVISTIESSMPSIDRGRREADRAAPPYFDPDAEGYQLAYLGLSADHPSLLMVIVTGDDPVISTLVGCNLAGVAAAEARNTLVVELDRDGRASDALRARKGPGVADLVAGNATWPDVTTPARIGRDRMVDLVPFGASAAPVLMDALVAMMRRDAMRLARYYDAIVIVAPSDAVVEGLPSALPSPEVIYCAQPRTTPLLRLRDQLERFRSAGAVIRGIVLWDAERPLLEDVAPRAEPRSRAAAPARPSAVATS